MLALTTTTRPTLGHAANAPCFATLPHHLFEVHYELRNGHKDTVPMISTTRAGAILRVCEMFDEQLRVCHAMRVLS